MCVCVCVCVFVCVCVCGAVFSRCSHVARMTCVQKYGVFVYMCVCMRVCLGCVFGVCMCLCLVLWYVCVAYYLAAARMSPIAHVSIKCVCVRVCVHMCVCLGCVFGVCYVCVFICVYFCMCVCAAQYSAVACISPMAHVSRIMVRARVRARVRAYVCVFFFKIRAHNMNLLIIYAHHIHKVSNHICAPHTQDLMYDNFHWNRYYPEIPQIQRLTFLNTISN